MRRAVLWALCTVLLWSVPAAAETILIAPIQGKGDAHKIEQELERALGERGSTVLGAHSKPAAEAAHCAGKVPCLGAAGRKAKAHKVLAGHMSSDAKGASVQFMLISSDGNAVIQTAGLSFPSGSDAAKVVNEGLGRVVPADEEPALQAVAPIKKRASFTAAPVSDGPALVSVERPGAHKPTRALLYAGISVAVAGAAGLVLGGVYYGQALGTVSSVHDDTRQPAALAADKRKDDQLLGANVGFIAGGALLGVGAALIATDLILRMRVQPRLNLGAHGAHASIEVPW